MRSWRWPTLIVLVALVAAAVTVERRPADVEGTAADLTRLGPVVAAPGTFGSTWYCAGGGSDQTIVIANSSDRELTGTITAYPLDGDRVEADFTIEPYTVRRTDVSSIVDASDVATLIEVDGGEVAVQHEVRADAGRSIGACASTPATHWYFPAGTTRVGAKMLLSVFNPFPGDAVLDITFDTDDGGREPQAYQGFVVSGGTVAVLDVSEVVTLRDEVATRIEARSGRVVVDQIQMIEGDSTGFIATLGAPSPAAGWVFPDGPGSDSDEERFVLFNPGDEPAEVDVAVMLDDPQTNGFAEPFDIRVPAGRYASVDVLGDGRVPPGVGHETLITSRNGVEIVAERVISGGSGTEGVTYTMGAPVAATRWIAATAALPDATGATVVIANPSASRVAKVVVRTVRSGRFDPARGMDGIELAPGERVALDIGADDADPFAIEVGSDSPVVVEYRFGFDDDISYLIATPFRDTLDSIRLDDLFGGLSPEEFVPAGDFAPIEPGTEDPVVGE